MNRTSTLTPRRKAAKPRRREAHGRTGTLKAGPLVFPVRPKIEDTELARRRVWRSKCGQWAVVNSVSKCSLPESWNVLRWEDADGLRSEGWEIVSRHRAKAAAFHAAQKLARETAT
jgi:hypothetical protein